MAKKFLIHNNILSESGDKYVGITLGLQVKTVQNSSKQICVWVRQAMAFFTEESVFMEYGLLWNMDYFSWEQWFEVKNILMINLFHTNMQFITSQDIHLWTGVVWIIVMFLSAV